MAGMEQIEIHSKSYLVRWINAKPGTTISWTIQPHKKTINFGIFKHPGGSSALTYVGTGGSSMVLGPPSPNPAAGDDDKFEGGSTAIAKLTSIGLKQVQWFGKCEADKATQGKYEATKDGGGNYALVFDNSFSKTTSKTVTVFLLTYPTASQSQIKFGAQLHHTQTASLAVSPGPQLIPKSPQLGIDSRSTTESLKVISPDQHPNISPLGTPTQIPAAVPPLDDSAHIHVGVLQKLRRKKHQGYARRFFCLDYTTSTLSYYHDRNSSALRGAIPLSLAAIGANAKSREISIDSGAEIWHLKAHNQADFTAWKKALENASRLSNALATPSGPLGLETAISQTPTEMHPMEDRDWLRLETLLSRLAGTRDAVRRLCLETRPPSIATTISPRSDSTPSTPGEPGADDYFRSDEKKPFWKRKPSSSGAQSNVFKRSVSAQLAVPLPGAETVLRNGGLSPGLAPARSPPSAQQRQEGDSMFDHCKALLHDLDTVVSEFTSMISENKYRRSPLPKSALSRFSIMSTDSQEYFDAEDGSGLLDIKDDSERESSTADDASSVASGDDETSSSTSQRRFRSGSVSSVFPPKAKSLAPLPLKPVQRRENVPPPTIMPPSLIGFLRKNVGKDLSTISMPVSANEPTSLLQRAAEPLEYSELLDRAATTADQAQRLLHVTAFAIAALSGGRVKERSIRKPFNPMLGETYELVREDQGYRFVSEKVSHRPVQIAFHAESADWAFSHSPLPSQKFWGKSSEIITEGKARVVLHTRGEYYSWSAATCFLRNIIAGEKYVEPVGTMTVVNETSGQQAVVTFKAKGMFSGRSEDVDVQLYDGQGAELPSGMVGTWTQSLLLKEHIKSTVWTAGQLVPNAPKHYGMTSFAAALNEITDIEKGHLPSTDSRLRADQKALENGKHDDAEKLKNELEEAQRARRKEMETAGKSWTPRWFTRVDNGDEVVWKLRTGKEGYWDERARQEWTNVVPVLTL